jgi:hypothetical protein
MIKFNITKHFLVRVFLIITSIVGLVGIFIFEAYPQLSYYLRIIFCIMVVPGIIIFEKTKPKR